MTTKKFRAKDFKVAEANQMSFDDICKKYNISSEELEKAIRNVMLSHSDHFLSLFHERDEKRQKQLAKKNRQIHNQEFEMKQENQTQNAVNINQTATSTAPKVLTTVKPEPTKLELLMQQKATILNKISETEKVLNKLHSDMQTVEQAIREEQKIIILVMRTGIITINGMEAFYTDIEPSELTAMFANAVFNELTLRQLKQLLQLNNIVQDILSQEDPYYEIKFEEASSKDAWNAWKKNNL